MRRAKLLVFVALVVSMAATRAWGASNSSSKSSWIPFSGKANTTKTQTTNGKPTTKPIPIVSSVSSGSKKLVSNTKSIFTPKKAAPVKRSGTTAVHASKPKQEQPGLFSRMFRSEPTPPPKTIKEWMSLKQVHP